MRVTGVGGSIKTRSSRGFRAHYRTWCRTRPRLPSVERRKPSRRSASGAGALCLDPGRACAGTPDGHRPAERPAGRRRHPWSHVGHRGGGRYSADHLPPRLRAATPSTATPYLSARLTPPAADAYDDGGQEEEEPTVSSGSVPCAPPSCGRQMLPSVGRSRSAVPRPAPVRRRRRLWSGDTSALRGSDHAPGTCSGASVRRRQRWEDRLPKRPAGPAGPGIGGRRPAPAEGSVTPRRARSAGLAVSGR
jgi:hypothetical protein